MGWWSATILGGDTPLDFLYDIEKAISIGGLYPITEWDEKTRNRIRDAIDRDPDVLLHIAPTYEHEVYMQTATVVLMAAGAQMTDEFRELAVRAGEEDEWAAEGDEDRCRHIGQYLNAVRAYNSTPTVLDEEGLFEKVLQAMG